MAEEDLQMQLSVFQIFRMVKLLSSRTLDELLAMKLTPGQYHTQSTLESEETQTMAAIFPSEEWLKGLEEKLNSDARYHDVAKNWEGDLFFYIEPEGNLKQRLTFYLDLWHGTCRKIEYNPSAETHSNPTFTLSATYKDITSILTGKLSPMTAMMTSKLKVKGSMSYMMRNVPTILDFVRVAQDSTSEIL
jgi:putative sterol carrier protein